MQGDTSRTGHEVDGALGQLAQAQMAQDVPKWDELAERYQVHLVVSGEHCGAGTERE